MSMTSAASLHSSSSPSDALTCSSASSSANPQNRNAPSEHGAPGSKAKGIVPTISDKCPTFVNATPGFVSSIFSTSSNEKVPQDSGLDYSTSWRSTGKQGYGFNRQGDKATGLEDFILQKPEESLPRYMTPPPQQVTVTRSASRVSSTSSFASP